MYNVLTRLGIELSKKYELNYAFRSRVEGFNNLAESLPLSNPLFYVLEAA